MPPIIHQSFTIERTYPTTTARVFDAHANPRRKRRWFAEGEGFLVESYSLDFQVGGFERCRYRFGADGPPLTYDGVYLAIFPNEGIMLAYTIASGAAVMSSSLVTIEFIASGGETLLRFTEHTAYLDGVDGAASRRSGSVTLLEALAKELAMYG